MDSCSAHARLQKGFATRQKVNYPKLISYFWLTRKETSEDFESTPEIGFHF
jgi:hypothetical protein